MGLSPPSAPAPFTFFLAPGLLCVDTVDMVHLRPFFDLGEVVCDKRVVGGMLSSNVVTIVTRRDKVVPKPFWDEYHIPSPTQSQLVGFLGMAGPLPALE